jgi:CBS domain containing-hemolysin-like protein
MESLCVKDLMVPISEYAAVRVGTSLLDAILELEKAQEAYTTSKYQHRAILVLDQDDTVIGKISQLRLLKAVETRDDLINGLDILRSFNFSDDYIVSQRQKRRLQEPIIDREYLHRVTDKKVEEFMQKPTPGEIVSEESSLDIAIHKLVSGTHLSLLVTREEKIVGILRIADVFAAVFHEMRRPDIVAER